MRANEVADIEILDTRAVRVGGLPVRRSLPRRGRRSVGAWCFVDHLGPVPVAKSEGPGVGPHPHMGLQTVTWLIEGEALHLDSLGSEHLIRPGELNLMTAGAGLSHAKESTSRYAGTFHGVQLWVALPETTRNSAPGFSHFVDLPKVELQAPQRRFWSVRCSGKRAQRDMTPRSSALISRSMGDSTSRSAVTSSTRWFLSMVSSASTSGSSDLVSSRISPPAEPSGESPPSTVCEPCCLAVSR